MKTLKRIIKNIFDKIKHDNKILWASVNSVVEIEQKLIRWKESSK